MIKRLIFDLDDTLIPWKDEYVDSIAKSIDKFNIKCDAYYLSSLFDDYENHYDRYDKEFLIEFFNRHIDDEVDMSFIDDFLYNISFCSEASDEVIDTLEYLSNKYDLVVLTNFFTTSQFNRLKHACIDKYFSKVIGADEFMKPQKEAFINACGELDVSECLMIGDDYDKDMIGAQSAGLHTLYYNYNKNDNVLNFDEFYNFSELKDIL